jgi:hypothetical protein
MEDVRILYEIICRYPSLKGTTTIAVKDYIDYFLPSGERRDVIGLDKERLEQTCQYLRDVYFEDYVFEIKEVP